MPDPHELRLLPRLIAPRRRVSFPIPRLPLLLYFSIGSIRSLAIHLSSLTSWRFPQKTKSWQNSAAGWSIFRNPRNLHARENWWNKTWSNRGTVPWLTFEPFTFSRTLTYIYIYIFPRETVEYFRSNRLLLYPVTTILSMEIFRSWPTEKYNKDIVFSSCEFACKMHERRWETVYSEGKGLGHALFDWCYLHLSLESNPRAKYMKSRNIYPSLPSILRNNPTRPRRYLIQA